MVPKALVEEEVLGCSQVLTAVTRDYGLRRAAPLFTVLRVDPEFGAACTKLAARFPEASIGGFLDGVSAQARWAAAWGVVPIKAGLRGVACRCQQGSGLPCAHHLAAWWPSLSSLLSLRAPLSAP